MLYSAFVRGTKDKNSVKNVSVLNEHKDIVHCTTNILDVNFLLGNISSIKVNHKMFHSVMVFILDVIHLIQEKA